jgi:YVTN family beta-propeller protein
MRFTLTILFTVFILTFALQSCKKDKNNIIPPIDYGNIGAIKYTKHVQALFNDKCATSGCHSSATKSAGLSLSSWNGAVHGSLAGEVLVPFRADKSLLTYLFDGTPLRRNHRTIENALTTAEINFLKRWINEGARNDANEVPFANSTNKLYVPNQGEDNVAVIDLDSMRVIRYVNVGELPAIEGPHFVTARDNFWYVSLIGAKQVWKFDTHNDTLVVGKANVPGSPALLTLTPDGSKLYVSQFMTSDINKVYVINTSTMDVEDTLTVGKMPHGIRINHSGTRLYCANMMSDNVTVVDVATNEVLEHIPLAWNANPVEPNYLPIEIAISPDDNFFAVSCSKNTKNEVRIFSTSSNALVDSFQVGVQPWHLQYLPDGNSVIVTNRVGNSVSQIHLAARHVNTILSASNFDYPHGCVLSANGDYTFVSNENAYHHYLPRYLSDYVGNVCVIDNALAQVVKVIEVGKIPTGLSVIE